MGDLSKALEELVGILEGSDTPYAIGGAIALGFWAQPRATKDIDVTLWCSPQELRRALSLLIDKGAIGEVGEGMRQSEERGLCVLEWRGVRLDVFTPSIDFYADALKRRTRITLAEIGDMWILSAEVLAVFKMLFFRGKDVVDVEQIVAVQGDRLDADFIRSQLVELVDADDERVKAWDGIVARYPRATGSS